MPKDLRVTLCQTNPIWENKTENLAAVTKDIVAHKNHTDLVIVPEMFSTGFSMAPENLAEQNNGNTVSSLINSAKESKLAICGSHIATNGTPQYFNRLFFIDDKGQSHFYDKRHLFTMGEEANHYTPGANNIIISYQGWTILPIICYDLRFPGWIRTAVPFDIMICVANWPKVRQEAWITLLKARAIENQCYVIGVNRTGKDGSNLTYSGNSMVFGPKRRNDFRSTV